RYPTLAFVPVASALELWNALCASPKARLQPGSSNVPVIDNPGFPDDGLPFRQAGPCSLFNEGVGWGSVIVVTSPATIPTDCNHVEGPAPGQVQDIGSCINLSQYPPIFLPPGVTLRGDRRGTNFGPQLYFSYLDGRNEGWPPNESTCPYDTANCMLEVRGDYARVTGLRLRGQTRSTDRYASATAAIGVGWRYWSRFPRGPTMVQLIATIDHNYTSDWGEAAVKLTTPFRDTHESAVDCSVLPGDPPTLHNVRIARNFLHHNERDTGGYGVSVGRAFIEGNVFVSN